MSTPNPYIASPSPEDAKATVAVTSSDIAAALRSTSHWVRVFAITFGAISVFQLVAGLSLVILSVSAPAPVSAAYWRGGLGLVLGAGIAVFPIMKLASFVRHAKALHEDNGYEHAADAIAEQRVFWQYVGVVTLLELVVAIVIFASN